MKRDLKGTQQYPPGTQEKYNSFQSRNPVMKICVKIGVTERQGGGKGEPWVPPKGTFGSLNIYICFSKLFLQYLHLFLLTPV